MDCLGISRSKSIYTDIVIDNYEEVISMNDGNSLLINLAGNNINVSEEETKFVNSLSESFKNKMIFISSAQVYGSSSEGPIAEHQQISKKKDYAKSKLALENKVLEHKGMVLRLSNIYGKGMSRKNIFHTIYSQVKDNRKEIALKNTMAIRDFIYIDDLCECILKIISDGVQNIILNIGTGKGTDILTLVKHICDNLNHTFDGLNIISENNFHDNIVVDPYLLKKKYNWKSKITIEEGIKKWLI